jgi:hypothetical protein
LDRKPSVALAEPTGAMSCFLLSLIIDVCRSCNGISCSVSVCCGCQSLGCVPPQYRIT